ncbi:hypothetical protein [Cellulomonas sp. H30R-01]|uniref:hypothetical protein n=1 Tax=Cellulomonas sp. H30R-01 TaxID=2704467 RepID=UPI00192EBAB2|nr:hypothetical protein [Cellulomonas sp. H30R-01]
MAAATRTSGSTDDVVVTEYDDVTPVFTEDVAVTPVVEEDVEVVVTDVPPTGTLPATEDGTDPGTRI